MPYRPFYEAVAKGAPATFANRATVERKTRPSIADLASVAGARSKTTPLSQPHRLSPEDQEAAFHERAGILEYDEGLPRAEAERLAHQQIRETFH